MSRQNTPVFLYILVFILLFLEVSRLFNLPFMLPDYSTIEKKIESSLKKELPDLVRLEIGTQIHELVMDKIHLNQTLSSSVQTSLNTDPIVMQVGETKVTVSSWQQREQEFYKKPEIASMDSTQKKELFVQEIQKHYAILEDCRQLGLSEEESFRQELLDYRKKVFLDSLASLELKSPTEQEILAYYEENKSLYEKDLLWNYRYLASENPDQLSQFSSVESFLASSSILQEKISQSQIPWIFTKNLKSLTNQTLSPVLHHEGKFYLLLKLSEPIKDYHPLASVSGFIQQNLSFLKLRNFLDSIANPLRFELQVTTDSSGKFLMEGKPLDPQTLKLIAQVLPAPFYTRLEQNHGELDQVHLEVELILRKFLLQPSYFPKEAVLQTAQKVSRYEEILLIRKRQEMLSSKTEVSKNEAFDYYNRFKDRFVKSQARLMSHIWILDRSKALEILNLSLMDPRHFPDLARQHSEEKRTSGHGGDMRYLSPQDLTEKIREIATKLKEGEICTELVPGVNGGYHILRFDSTVPSSVQPFEEIEEKLIQALKQEKQARVLNEYVTETLKKYKPVFDQNLLVRLQEKS